MYSHNGLKKKEYTDVIFKYIYNYTKLIDLRAKNDHDGGSLLRCKKVGHCNVLFMYLSVRSRYFMHIYCLYTHICKHTVYL